MAELSYCHVFRRKVKKEYDSSGIYRLECLRECEKWLSHDGCIVVDNVNRPDLNKAVEAFYSKGWKRIIFYGLTNGDHRLDVTAVLYKSENALGI